MTPAPAKHVMTPEELRQRRAQARRMAVYLGLVALAVYGAFIYMTAVRN